MILYDYDYDLLHQPFFSRVLDEEHEITIKFVIPENVFEIFGFKIKLAKSGNPGPILYKLGTQPGSRDLSEGIIDPEEVMPLFETFVCVKTIPIATIPGSSLFLSLKALSGNSPMDCYRIFGPRQEAEGGFDEAETIPYWWDVKYSEGMAVPSYYKPALYKPSPLCSLLEADGSESGGVSFGICTSTDDSEKKGEQRFEFIKELVAPPFSEWKPLKCNDCDSDIISDNEVLINNSWGLEWNVVEDTPLCNNIKNELRQFFYRCFSIELKGKDKYILFNICEDGIPDGSESHVIYVTDTKIEVTARNVKGLLRAVHYIEDVMTEKKRPVLRKGKHTRKSLYEIRMTNGIYPAPFNYFALQCAGIWTDGYLWRMARAGYNALWLMTNMEELTENSSVFPELNHPGAKYALDRLQKLTQKAAEFGLDVYIEIRTGYFRYFDERIYDRLPQIKTFHKWGNYPCTGNQHFYKFLNETLQNLFERVKDLKGIIIIYDTEGFYNCFLANRQEQCPICKGESSDKLAFEFFKTVLNAMKSKNKNAELIAWTYFCDEPWNYKLISELPKDVKILSCYSQFVEFERYGIKNRTDDYACCVTGPSEYFVKVYDIATAGGHKVLAKTEVSFGQEFVGIPYVPCLTQHQRRWDSMRERSLLGYMGDYIHRGFVPSPCTDLMRQNIFETEIDGIFWQDSNEKLEFVASLNYGKKVSRAVVEAWNLFSRAMNEYFPYSPGVCRYPGPLQASPGQPFYLDKDRKVKRYGARYNTNDLEWTKAYSGGSEIKGWNAELIRRCFEKFVELYNQGIDILENCLHDHPDNPERFLRMLRIAKMQVCMVRSIINFIDFVNLRDRLDSCDNKKAVYQKMKTICENELENVKKSLELCTADSNLGFSCEGQGTVRGGYFTPFTIQEKIAELNGTIDAIDSFLRKDDLI